MESNTVWKRQVKFEKSEALTRVQVDTDGGVSITAITVGPRGGGQVGCPGFTAAEWDAVTAAVAAARAALGAGAAEKGSSEDVQGVGVVHRGVRDGASGPVSTLCYGEGPCATGLQRVTCPDCLEREAEG